MGGSQSNIESFSVHLASLKSKTIDINDHDYWAKLFTQKLYHLDVFDSINEKDVTYLRIRKPENLAILIFKCIEQLHLFAKQTDPAATTGDRSLSAVTALVFLARILPYILFRLDAALYKPNMLSEYATDFAMHVLVSNMMCVRESKNNAAPGSNVIADSGAPTISVPSAAPSNGNDSNNDNQAQHEEEQEARHLVFPQLEEGRPLGDTMIRAITAVAFVPGFTCGTNQVLGEPTAEYLKNVVQASGYTYLRPEALWKAGIASRFIKNPPLNTDQGSVNRSLVIRALMAAFASQAYSANGNQPARLRYFFNEPRENPLCQSLVASMLSLVCNYYPYGTLPYTSHIVWQEEALIADCVSALTVIFDVSVFHQELARDSKTGRRRFIEQDDALEGHAAWNLINNLPTDDASFIFNGLLTLLANNSYSRMTYLPGSQRVLPFRDEVFILLWKLLYKSRNFRKQFCARPDVCQRVVVPVVTLLIDGIENNATRASMLQLAVMLLETLSMEREFALALNIPFTDYTPFKLPAWQGTYFDLIVYAVHATLACRNRAALSMHHAALCTIANLAPCATSMSMLSATKMMQLFEQYSKKEWLDAAQPPDHMLQVLLYSVASSMQYQFSGSTHLAYALLRRAGIVKDLWEYIRLRSIAKNNNASAPPPPLKEGEETSSSSSSDDEEDESTSSSTTSDAEKKEGKEVTDPASGKQYTTVTDKKNKHRHQAAVAGAAVAAVAPPPPPSRPRFGRSVLTHIFTLKCTVEALESVVLDRLKADPNFDVHSLLQSSTLVGKMPVPHPLLVHRVPESPEIDHWSTSVVWSTLNSRSTLSSRPLLHAAAIRLFARPQPVQRVASSDDDASDGEDGSASDDASTGTSSSSSTPSVGKKEGNSKEGHHDDDDDDEEMQNKGDSNVTPQRRETPATVVIPTS